VLGLTVRTGLDESRNSESPNALLTNKFALILNISTSLCLYYDEALSSGKGNFVTLFQEVFNFRGASCHDLIFTVDFPKL
jgi:hypothetical protein